MAGVQTIDISEDDKHIRTDHVGYQGPQSVVIGKTQLFSGDRIVFIDDGHNTELKQGEDGVAYIEIATPVGEVCMGEQNLSHLLVKISEGLLIGLHQQPLPGGGQGLLYPQLLVNALGNAEPAPSGSNCPGTDQNHLAAG